MGILKGNTALVTGSTSGTGLACARAFASGGTNIVLNGMGAPAEVEKERSAIENDFGVKSVYSPADMRKPSEIAEMIVARRRGESNETRLRHSAMSVLRSLTGGKQTQRGHPISVAIDPQRSSAPGAHSRDPLARNDGLPLADRANFFNRFNESARRANHQFPVQPLLQKYFASRLTQIRSITRAIPSHTEGRFAVVTDVGTGCDGRGSVRRARMRAGRMTLMRTAKSCGSGTPMLVSSFAELFAERRCQTSLVTGESAK